MVERRVRDFMTAHPVSVDSEASVIEAHRLMRENGVRHLPVFGDGRLVGMVSEQDVHLIESLKEVDPALEPVDAAMEPEPFRVHPDAPLDEVVERMLAERCDAAVVMDEDRLLGVFTHSDALEALLEMLRGDRVVPLLAQELPARR